MNIQDLRPGLVVTGIVPQQAVTVVDVRWHGTAAVELTYKLPDGSAANRLLFAAEAELLEVVAGERRWDFSADSELFRLVAEAYRIRLAHLFDPVLAVHTSLVEPLPHQITGVYGDMLPRQPLRFLLADDPGAGKTIMAGLLLKELIARGDVRRCLICVPGSLAAQWQDEMWFRFGIRFTIFSRETYEAAVSGNAFREHNLAIIRLDQVARNERLRDRLEQSEWDLVIVDEAHKMSAHYWSSRLEETQRFKLGRLLSEITRHLLLMTATPHNGKEEDFQLFLQLIDPDRFAGQFRAGVPQVDASDIMRRMVKENLLRFDGRPLFPERRAYTVNYPLSPAEAALYEQVTEYVRQEFNRAEQLGDDRRRGTVGFALTILQRRLASSPEAIYRSLGRRRERLEKRLAEVKAGQRTAEQADEVHAGLPAFDEQGLLDLEDAPAEELEEIEESVLDSATAALTIRELQAEIETLKRLERTAHRVRHSGADRKWEELAAILQDEQRMVDEHGHRRKLVIFTEHRDTLTYLSERIGTLFGRQDMLVTIDGSVQREIRRAIEDRFRNDPDVFFLVATDAAGEGINLQRAHLMINYDLPWNPNRLEQRFGRIHRIGQTEVCHLWNLVSADTREGYVYERLLRKLEAEGSALQGKVFDILGQLFDRKSLRELLIEAIRYGDRPDVRARLEQAIEEAVDQEHIRQLLEQESLAGDSMDISQVIRVREEMERYAARRLQPHYIKAFFLKAFELLDGRLVEREPGRFRISYVPARIRHRAADMGTTVPVLERYERIAFDKQLLNYDGLPQADFVCPGHPLLDTVIELTLDQHREMMRSGAVLVDRTDPGDRPRVLFFLEQNIRDAGGPDGSQPRVISREVHFVEIDEAGNAQAGGQAPYLDYEPPTPQEMSDLASHSILSGGWLAGDALEGWVLTYAIEQLVPAHLERVRRQREALIDKTLAAVHERLSREILYWDKRAVELRRQEKEGRQLAGLNSVIARRRSEEMAQRLEERTAQLRRERQISAAPPVIVGGAIVIPAGLLNPALRLGADPRITERIAMQAVMEAEIRLGHDPQDVSRDKLGYDIESLDARTGRLRFIEVKGRQAGTETVTVTRNEILRGLNSPEQFILALVEVSGGRAQDLRYVRRPFQQEPGWEVVSINYDWQQLWQSGVRP